MIIDQSYLRYELITNTLPQAMPEKKRNARHNYKLRTPKSMCLGAKVFIVFLIELASRIGLIQLSTFCGFW